MRRVFVGKSYAEAPFWVGVFAAIAGGIASVALLVSDMEAGAVLCGIAAAIGGVVAIVRWLDISKNRRWVTPSDTGFTLEDKRGIFDFDDEMITDLGTWSKVRFQNGEPKGVTRKLHLVVRVGELSSDFLFEYEYGLNATDPLEGFLNRNLERLFDTAWANWQAGRSLEGEGWLLDREGLTHGAGARQQTLAMHEIAAVDVVDGKVSIWAVGQALPFLKIPGGTPNALILGRLISKKLEERGTKDEDPADGLGRVIFERDHSMGMGGVIYFGFFGLLLVVFGLVVIICADGKLDQILMGVGLLLAGPIIPLIAFLNRTKILRCHTHGVCYLTAMKERKLQYKDVRIFTFSATRNYTNGSYTGTAISLTFEPGDEGSGDRIAYSANIKQMDDELDNLRDFVSRVIAVEMLKRVKQGRTVYWTDGLRFLPEALEVQPSGFFGKKDAMRIPYSEIAGSDMQQGVFYLFRKGQNKHFFEIPVSSPNFFPGMLLLHTILSPEEAGGSGDSAPTT